VRRAPYETGIVLSGGGARAAYQIGVLHAIAHMLGRTSTTPFRVICGTSAGAVNAAFVAADADNFRRGVARLLRLWRNIEVRRVYKADFGAVSTHGMRWLASVLIGSRGPARTGPSGTPGELASAEEARSGWQSGAGACMRFRSTRQYTTGHAGASFKARRRPPPWQRTRRRGERAIIGVEHLLASSAIPSSSGSAC
jgi:NTE family protein